MADEAGYPAVVISCFTGNQYEGNSPEDMANISVQLRDDDKAAQLALLQDSLKQDLSEVVHVPLDLPGLISDES